MSKRTLITIIILLCLYVVLSVFFCYEYKLRGLYFVAIPFVIEYGARCWKYKKVVIPFREYFSQLLNNQLGETGIISPETIPNPVLIDSLKDIKAYDFFITVSAKKDYSPLGTGAHEQLLQCYYLILSKYQEIKADPQYIKRMRMIKKKSLLELNYATTVNNAGILQKRYSPAAIEYMRKQYPMYQFTEETLANDLDMVRKGEIANEIEYEELEKEIERMDAQGNSKVQTIEQQEKNYVAAVMGFTNDAMKTSYDPFTITLLEYAVAENRLNDYIDNLKQQSARRGR